MLMGGARKAAEKEGCAPSHPGNLSKLIASQTVVHAAQKRSSVEGADAVPTGGKNGCRSSANKLGRSTAADQ